MLDDFLLRRCNFKISINFSWHDVLQFGSSQNISHRLCASRSPCAQKQMNQKSWRNCARHWPGHHWSRAMLASSRPCSGLSSPWSGPWPSSVLLRRWQVLVQRMLWWLSPLSAVREGSLERLFHISYSCKWCQANLILVIRVVISI